jgi:preprotein translocase subunit SecD
MKNLLPIVLAVCLLLAAAMAAAVGVVYWLSMTLGPPTPPPGKFLVYEIDPTLTPDPAAVDMQALVAAIDRRINPGWSRNARVRELPNRLIEVAVFGDDREKVRQVERLLENSGTLEFRIFAHERIDEKLIEQARRESSNVVRDSQGKALAWWVPVKEGFNVQGWGNVARIKKADNLETLEVLVLADEFNVTSAYLKRAVVERDPQGQPRLAFELNAAGASLLAGLTTSNLFDPSSASYRSLGTILGGRLYSGLVIQSTITGRPEINVWCTPEEAEELVEVLNAGTLPAAIRMAEGPVEEAPPAEEPAADATPENAP